MRSQSPYSLTDCSRHTVAKRMVEIRFGEGLSMLVVSSTACVVRVTMVLLLPYRNLDFFEQFEVTAKQAIGFHSILGPALHVLEMSQATTSLGRGIAG
jgi:hypothetical protein